MDQEALVLTLSGATTARVDLGTTLQSTEDPVSVRVILVALYVMRS